MSFNVLLLWCADANLCAQYFIFFLFWFSRTVNGDECFCLTFPNPKNVSQHTHATEREPKTILQNMPTEAVRTRTPLHIWKASCLCLRWYISQRDCLSDAFFTCFFFYLFSNRKHFICYAKQIDSIHFVCSLYYMANESGWKIGCLLFATLYYFLPFNFIWFYCLFTLSFYGCCRRNSIE